MITRFLCSVGRFVSNLAVGATPSQLVGTSATQHVADTWLFEDTRNIKRLAELPQFPSARQETDGERHCLEILDVTMTEVLAGLRDLQRLAEVQLNDVKMPKQELQQHVEALCDNVIQFGRSAKPARLADVAVSEFLFDALEGRIELDDELFECTEQASTAQLVAAKVSGHFQRLQRGQDYEVGISRGG